MEGKALSVAMGFVQLPPELMDEAEEDSGDGPSCKLMEDLEQNGNQLRERQRQIKAEHKLSEAAAKAWYWKHTCMQVMFFEIKWSQSPLTVQARAGPRRTMKRHIVLPMELPPSTPPRGRATT